MLPLSAKAAETCLAAFAALGGSARNVPAPRPPGGLPAAVEQALGMLGDREFRKAAGLARSLRAAGKADPGPGLRERRRTLLRNLQRRYPEGVSAIRAACGPPARRDGDKIIIVSVFTHLIVITGGELRCFENPFDGCDPAD